jgi:hypothetical protein
MTAVMCVTEELQVTAQLVGVMPKGHPGVLPTAPLVQLGIPLDLSHLYTLASLTKSENVVMWFSSGLSSLFALDMVWIV